MPDRPSPDTALPPHERALARQERRLVDAIARTWPGMAVPRARRLARLVAAGSPAPVVLELAEDPTTPWVGDRAGVSWAGIRDAERRGLVCGVHVGAQEIRNRLREAQRETRNEA